MTEENQIIPNDTQNNYLKSFFLNNKKSVISFFIIIFLALFAYFFYSDYKKDIKSQISEKSPPQYKLSLIFILFDVLSPIECT